MPVEAATYIDDLNAAYPQAADGMSEGDNHLRLIKSVLKTTFPAFTGALSASNEDLDAMSDQAGTTGTLEASGGTGVRSIRLVNVSGVLQVQFTDTAHLNPDSVATLDHLGNLAVEGDLAVGDDLTVAGDASVTGGLAVTGAQTGTSINLSGSATVGNDLTVIDAATIGGNATVTGTLSVTGTQTGSSINLSGSATVGNDLTVTDDVTIGGDTTLTGGLAVTGAQTGTTATFSGAVTAVGVTSSDDIEATGAAFILPGASGIKFPDLTVMTTAPSLEDAYDPAITMAATSAHAVFHSTGADLVLKAGRGVTNGSGVQTVTFPTAFPTACVSVVLSPEHGADNTSIEWTTISATAFSVRTFDEDGSLEASASYTWIAVGY